MLIKTTKMMDSLRQEGERQKSIQEALVSEHYLEIQINQRPFTITMCTPGAERYLTRGLLHAEGVSPSHFESFHLLEQKRGLLAQAKIQCSNTKIQDRSIASTSSCGLCGKKTAEGLFEGIEPIDKNISLPTRLIENIYRECAKQQKIFQNTGGCHAASAVTIQGDILCLFEDIGRHNAVDKVIGYCLEHDLLDRAAILTVSGRLSYEIVQKCARAKIPILTAISAPSSLAVEMAKEWNITLAGFCREGRATFYSGLHRIQPLKAKTKVCSSAAELVMSTTT
jgi:FdhD protein